jgi:hypothetical protein
MSDKTMGRNLGIRFLFVVFIISFVHRTHYDIQFQVFHFPYSRTQYQARYFREEAISLFRWSFIAIFIATFILFWIEFKHPKLKLQIAIQLVLPLTYFYEFFIFTYFGNLVIHPEMLLFGLLFGLLIVIGEVMTYVGRPRDRKGQYVSQPSSPTDLFGMDAPTRIRNLKKLHDDGLITNEEYEKKKAELLNAL